MSGYSIVDSRKIDTHITFIRIKASDISLTLKDVYTSLADLAWISQFDEDYIREAFEVRAEASVKYLADNIIKETDDEITSNSGEYVISELARKTVVNHLSYLDIPLAELIKDKDIGNHGFDFYSRNNSEIILFGEAKYDANQTAYGKALEQIIRFEQTKQDKSDILDIDKFCCTNSKTNFSKGHKGFIAAFASHRTATDRMIGGIMRNVDYQKASKFHELICIAVDL